jgi:hypothetical protein
LGAIPSPWHSSQDTRARAIVRKESQIQEIPKALGAHLKDAVEYVVVSDLAAEHAFDKLMKDVRYVFHVASPMNNPVSTLVRRGFPTSLDRL